MSRWKWYQLYLLNFSLYLATGHLGIGPALAQTDEVGPLDDWQQHPAVQVTKATPTAGPTKTYYQINLSTPTPAVTLPPSAKPRPSIYGGDYVTLSKVQRKRLAKVESKVRKMVRKELAERSRWVDPRGEPELKICSADLNGYGEKSDVNRIYKKAGVARLKKTKSSFMTAAKSADCDVIALQGVVGRSIAFAKTEMLALAADLGKETGASWKVIVPESRRRSAYHFFLLRYAGPNSQLSFLATTHTDLVVDVLKHGETEAETVPRDFFQFSLQVAPRAEKSEMLGPARKSREVTIINGTLAGPFAPFPSTSQFFKLQLAEIAAALLQREEEDVTPEKQQIVLLIVNRGEKSNGAVEEILTGRLKINDFKPSDKNKDDAICKLAAKESTEEEGEMGAKPKKVDQNIEPTHIECKEPIHRPKSLFNLLEPPPEVAKKKGKKEIPPARLTGIYLTQNDLPVAVKEPGKSSRNATGTIPIVNGIPGAELVWVELNW